MLIEEQRRGKMTTTRGCATSPNEARSQLLSQSSTCLEPHAGGFSGYKRERITRLPQQSRKSARYDTISTACDSPARNASQLVPSYESDAAGSVVQFGVQRRTSTKNRRIRSAPPRNVEARLRRLLQLLTPPARRAVLATRFTQAQRLALERWILATPSKSKETDGRHPSDASGKARGTSRQCCRLNADGLGRSTAEDVHARLPQSGVRGVHTRLKCGRLSYCAATVAGPFILSTKYHRDHSKALRFQQVLSSLRERLAQCRHLQTSPEFEKAFRAVIFEVPKSHGLDAVQDMDLRFAVVVAAKHWVGTALKTPQFSVARQLDEGLHAWRRLREARAAVYNGRMNGYSILKLHHPEELETTWQQLRQVYLSVCVEAGNCQARVEGRIRALEDKHVGCRRRFLTRWHLLRLGSAGGSRVCGPQKAAAELGRLPRGCSETSTPMTAAFVQGAVAALPSSSKSPFSVVATGAPVASTPSSSMLAACSRGFVSSSSALVAYAASPSSAPATYSVSASSTPGARADAVPSPHRASPGAHAIACQIADQSACNNDQQLERTIGVLLARWRVEPRGRA